MWQQKSYKQITAFIICGLAALFYLYEFVLQVLPSTITVELMQDLQLDAGSLGVMAAFYYYAYTPMQLPAGMLYDHFGPRKIMSLAILICAIGALFFSLTTSFALASAGRFLMGVGSAFSFSGALLLISRWFPSNYFPFLSGVVQFMSAIGAICGQIPLAVAAMHYGWRDCVHWLTVIGIILALTIWLVVRDYPPNAQIDTSSKHKKTLNQLATLLQAKQLWFTAGYSFAVWAPIAAFAALWGIPFLVVADAVPTHMAASYIAFVWLGVGIGSPLLGWCSEKIKSRRLPLITVAILGILAISTIIYLPGAPKIILLLSLFFLGIAGAGQSLAFALINDSTEPSMIGTAIGFNNMAIVAGGAIFQPIVGLLLRHSWHGAMLNGIRFHSVSEYQHALLILPLCYVLALIISYKFLRESRHFVGKSG